MAPHYISQSFLSIINIYLYSNRKPKQNQTLSLLAQTLSDLKKIEFHAIPYLFKKIISFKVI